MGLREKYDHAIQTAKSLRFNGSAQEQNGKLHFKGTADSQEDANKIWNAIKTIPDWQSDIVADTPGAVPHDSANRANGHRGDDHTSAHPHERIAQRHLGVRR